MPTLKDITPHALRTKVQELGQEFPSRSTASYGCHYTPQNVGSGTRISLTEPCIIGEAYLRLGVPESELRTCEGKDIATVLIDNGHTPSWWLTLVQDTQDNSVPWGTCVELADATDKARTQAIADVMGVEDE